LQSQLATSRDSSNRRDLISSLIASFDFDGARRALQVDLQRPGADREWAQFTLASMLMQEGQADEACSVLRGLIAQSPRRRDFWSTYLTALKTAKVSSNGFVNAHRAFASTFIDEECEARPRGLREPRQLQLGFTGADGHFAILRFLDPLRWSRHSTTLFVRSAEAASRLANSFPDARCVLLPPDPLAACGAIEAAGIDILVDLCGHGPGGVLDIIARRPAPVIATWLDYLATTGLPAVAHRITDWIADPPGNERFHVESLARLPFAAWCYSPYSEAPQPSSSSGAAVAGSACIPLKMTDRTLALWRQALEAAPHARLVLMGFLSTPSRQRVLAALGPRVAERTTLLARLPLAQYLATLSTFDVALDAIEFSGGTSTMDCLWQGVPVVTLPGELSHSRTTASLLWHSGASEDIAHNPEEFVTRVAGHLAKGRNEERLARRHRLRELPLCNPMRFAKGLDELLSSMWVTQVSHGAENTLLTLLRDALHNPLDRERRSAVFRDLASVRR
jgi:protein O-GlcNAc transferase